MFTACGDSLCEELIFLLPIVKLLLLSTWPHRQRRHHFYWIPSPPHPRPPVNGWSLLINLELLNEGKSVSVRGGRGTRSWWLDGQGDAWLLKEQRDERLISQSVISLNYCLQTMDASPITPAGTAGPSSLSDFLCTNCQLHQIPCLVLYKTCSLELISWVNPPKWPRITPGRIITPGRTISSVAPCCSMCIIHLWSIAFCGEPSSHRPVMIAVLATLCICAVI